MVLGAKLGAAAALLAAALLRPDWSVRLLTRFQEEDRRPQDFPGRRPPVPGYGIAAREAAPFVLLLTPQDPSNPPSGDFLSEFLDNHTAWFKEVYLGYGSVIFRGFAVPDARSFEKVVLGITTDLATAYLGTSPRSSIEGTTYVHTAADFDPHRTLPTHLEMSFRDNPPKTQMFYAYRVDHWRGGETPLTDFAGVWRTISSDADLREKFERARVKYVRNNDDCASLSTIDPLVQKCWQDMFKTSNRSKVLEKCEEERFECNFLEEWNGRLRMSNTQPFIRKHPVSGETVWFNHINVLTRNSMVFDYERTASLWAGWSVWWPMILGIYYRTLFGALSLVWSELDFGSAVVFEDGSPIAEEDLRQIKRAVWRNTVQFPYELHDIVIVDNMRVGHGREMYLGGKASRMIMTAWSDNYPTKWFPKGE